MTTAAETMLSELRDAPWLIDESALDAIVARAPLFAARGGRDQPPVTVGTTVQDGVATIEVRGVFAPRASWWSDNLVVTGEVARALEQAAADRSVRAIALRIDSPGGQAAGIQDLAETVAAVADQKPVHVLVDGMAASAAYWVASQGTDVSATPGSRVGSIGAYLVALDASRLAENMGVKVHVIRSGPEKGVGTLGAPLTEAHVAALQGQIDALAGDFTAAVAAGRGMPMDKAQGLSTGRMWRSSDALSQGLIDKVEPSSASMTRIVNSTKERFTMEAKELNEAQAAGVAAERARVSSINKAFSDDPEFAREQIDAGATLEEASVAYVPRLRSRMHAEIAAAKTQVAAPPPAPSAPARSTPPVPHGEPARAGGDFMAQARARAAEKKTTLTTAMRELARENPALHKAFVGSQRPVALGDETFDRVQR